MAFITAQEISGASVYGIPQVSYTVDGVSGQDYATAVAQASLKQAAAFEQECSALTSMVKLRMKKTSDLGETLAHVVQMKALLPTDDMDPDDKLYQDELKEPLIRYIKNTLDAYSFEKSFYKTDDNEEGYFQYDDEDGPYMTRDDINYLENDVKYEIDRENNDLQQDLLTVQSMFSKRDNAFSTAKQLVQKILNAAQTMIGNMGE